MNTCHCGKPIQDTARLCPDCGGTLRRNLYKIADRWAELEDALTWREVLPGVIGTRDDGPRQDGERKTPLATGTTINERAVRARREATDAVWFALQVIREDYDNQGWTFDPPRQPNTTQDGTPALARWLAGAPVDHIVKHADQESAEEIANGIAKAERAVFKATHPSEAHWAPVNLSCDMWTTSDRGERVPCPGDMWAYVGTGVMPDLVCNHDETHKIDPQVWERVGWKRRLRMPLDPHGVARLAERMGR